MTPVFDVRKLIASQLHCPIGEIHLIEKAQPEKYQHVLEQNEKDFNKLNKNLVKNVVKDVKNICYEVAREDIVAESDAPAAD